MLLALPFSTRVDSLSFHCGQAFELISAIINASLVAVVYSRCVSVCVSVSLWLCLYSMIHSQSFNCTLSLDEFITFQINICDAHSERQGDCRKEVSKRLSERQGESEWVWLNGDRGERNEERRRDERREREKVGKTQKSYTHTQWQKWLTRRDESESEGRIFLPSFFTLPLTVSRAKSVLLFCRGNFRGPRVARTLLSPFSLYLSFLACLSLRHSVFLSNSRETSAQWMMTNYVETEVNREAMSDLRVCRWLRLATWEDDQLPLQETHSGGVVYLKWRIHLLRCDTLYARVCTTDTQDLHLNAYSVASWETTNVLIFDYSRLMTL